MILSQDGDGGEEAQGDVVTMEDPYGCQEDQTKKT